MLLLNARCQKFIALWRKSVASSVRNSTASAVTSCSPYGLVKASSSVLLPVQSW
ncbi:hypothetical protein ACNKHP_15295 [Shigella boydii]